MKKLNESRTLATRLFAAGMLLAIARSASAATHYVDVNSTNATPPYTNCATAATTIQDAVDAAVAGDEIMVTNGNYQPVAVGRPLSVRSINGAQSTTIDGGGSVRCVYMTNGATLSGFTLRQGFVFEHNGGGAYGGTLNDCWLTHNSALGDLAVHHQPAFPGSLGHQLPRARRCERNEHRYQSHYRPAAVLPAD